MVDHMCWQYDINEPIGQLFLFARIRHFVQGVLIVLVAQALNQFRVLIDEQDQDDQEQQGQNEHGILAHETTHEQCRTEAKCDHTLEILASLIAIDLVYHNGLVEVIEVVTNANHAHKTKYQREYERHERLEQRVQLDE
jgi:hypothetical protein